MARIIESENSLRRLVKLSTDDVLSVVREYQRITGKQTGSAETRCLLEDSVIYIPEDV